jgi:hypothetical protein
MLYKIQCTSFNLSTNYMTTNYAIKTLYNVFQNASQNTKKQIQEIKNLQNSKNQKLTHKP